MTRMSRPKPQARHGLCTSSCILSDLYASCGANKTTFHENMDSDDDAQMDVEPISAMVKGKEKAVDRERPYENENLPWLV